MITSQTAIGRNDDRALQTETNRKSLDESYTLIFDTLLTFDKYKLLKP